MRVQEKGSSQAQSSGPSTDAPKKNNFYALRSKGDQEESPDVVTCMLHLFSINSMLYFILVPYYLL